MAELVPGRDLDVLIASKVMKWPDATGWGSPSYTGPAHPRWYWAISVNGELRTHHDRPWSPSTSIADAFEVVEKLNWLQFCIEHENCSGVRWDISAYNQTDCADRIHVTVNEAPFGICLVVLKAVGYEHG